MMTKGEENIRDLIKVQCYSGNWNSNSYMMGLANGLILALSCITGEEPEFLKKPEVWLDNLPKPEFLEVCNE